VIGLLVIKNSEFSVVYDQGVLRPEVELGLPDQTRLLVSIRRVTPTPADESEGRRIIDEIRTRGLIRLDSWRPQRDELHERR
jgi:hypothetical protein